MNRQISFPNAPLVRRPALNLRNSNPRLLVQPAVHSSAHQFSFFPHAIFLWSHYQTLCMTVRLSFHSSTVYVLCTSGCLLYMQLQVLLFPLSFCYVQTGYIICQQYYAIHLSLHQYMQNYYKFFFENITTMVIHEICTVIKKKYYNHGHK